VVIAVGCPPPEFTRHRPLLLPGAKTIAPDALHVPPRPPPASQIVCAAPSGTVIRFSFPPAKKASEKLSGDQNG